jgi:hypothetical protein
MYVCIHTRTHTLNSCQTCYYFNSKMVKIQFSVITTTNGWNEEEEEEDVEV